MRKKTPTNLFGFQKFLRKRIKQFFTTSSDSSKKTREYDKQWRSPGNNNKNSKKENPFLWFLLHIHNHEPELKHPNTPEHTHASDQHRQTENFTRRNSSTENINRPSVGKKKKTRLHDESSLFKTILWLRKAGFEIFWTFQINLNLRS